MSDACVVFTTTAGEEEALAISRVWWETAWPPASSESE